MSGRGKALPFHLLFFLILCIFSLAFHFGMEGLTGLNSFALEIGEQGEHSDFDDEEDEDDHFIFPRPAHLQTETAIHSIDTRASSKAAFVVLPLLPPPNA